MKFNSDDLYLCRTPEKYRENANKANGIFISKAIKTDLDGHILRFEDVLTNKKYNDIEAYDDGKPFVSEIRHLSGYIEEQPFNIEHEQLTKNEVLNILATVLVTDRIYQEGDYHNHHPYVIKANVTEYINDVEEELNHCFDEVETDKITMQTAKILDSLDRNENRFVNNFFVDGLKSKHRFQTNEEEYKLSLR